MICKACGFQMWHTTAGAICRCGQEEGPVPPDPQPPDPARAGGPAKTQAELLVALAQKLARESADPREEVRKGAEKRMCSAFEAMSGVAWTTYRQVRIVLSVMRMAAHEAERGVGTATLVAQEPALASHEEQIRAAIDGCAGGRRVWPPLLELLGVAGLAGGITDPDHLKRKFLATVEMTGEDRAFFGR